MFSFFRRRNKKPVVPTWADFFSQSEYEAFLAALDAYFKPRGLPYVIDDGIVETYWLEPTGEPQKLGLVNLAQMCKQQKVEEYPNVVRLHFERMQQSQGFIKEFNDHVNDFQFARPFIGTRLYHQEYLENIEPQNAVFKQVTEDIVAMLVFDMPQAVTNVRPENVRAWGISPAELLTIGQENIAGNYNFTVVELDAGVPLKAVIEDHFFGSNILLELADHPELVGPHGTLVGVPHRHTTLLYPIHDIEVVQAINTMIPIIHGMHHEGPGSISSNLFWYRDGGFENLPYKIEGGSQTSFHPPQNLVSLLNYLSLEAED